MWGGKKLQGGSFISLAVWAFHLKLPLSRAQSWTHKLSGPNCLKFIEKIHKIQMLDNLPFPNNRLLLILRAKHKRKNTFQKHMIAFGLCWGRLSWKCNQNFKYLETSTNINFVYSFIALLFCIWPGIPWFDGYPSTIYENVILGIALLETEWTDELSIMVASESFHCI